MSNELLTTGNTAPSIDEFYLFLTNLTVEDIRNFMKRVRKKDSAVILASQNLEDFIGDGSGFPEFSDQFLYLFDILPSADGADHFRFVVIGSIHGSSSGLFLRCYTGIAHEIPLAALVDSCGIHVHVDASPFNANTLRNITNIMASKEDLIYKALEVTVARQHRWCKPLESRFLEELNQRKPKTLEQVSCIWYNGASA